MIALRALALIAFILIPGWLAVAMLEKNENGLDGLEKIFLATAFGTGIVSASALVLALASIYSLSLLLVLVGAACLLMAWRSRRGAAWVARLKRRDTLAALLVVIIALVLFAPPWGIVLGWSDVGIYPNIAAHIEREGGVSIENRTAASVSEERAELIYYPKQLPSQPDVYFENQFYSIEDLSTGEVRPMFYMLWPCLLAVFASFLGIAEMFWALTAMAVLALLGLFVLANRLLSWRWAIAAAVLFALSPLIIYFARYTTSEMMNAVLFLSGMLCLLAYTRDDREGRGWGLAVSSAAFFTLGLLCRIDFIYILLPILLCYLAKRILTGLSSRDLLFLCLTAAGAAASMLVGYLFCGMYFRTLWNSFTRSLGWLNSPLGWVLVFAVLLLFIIGPRLRGYARKLLRARRMWLAIMWAALAAIFVYLYFIRPLSPDTIVNYGFIKYAEGPKYMNENLVRWGWYFSFIGLVLIFAGYGAWFSRRRDFGEVSLMFTAFAFTFFYAWNMRALPMHILAMRRLVPVIFPMAVVAIVYALRSMIEVVGKATSGTRWYKLSSNLALIAAGGALFFLVLFFTYTSVPALGLDEGGNQLEISGQLAEQVSEDGTVLMDYYSGDLFGPPLRSIYGTENAWLKDGVLENGEDLLALLDDLGFPREPVYLLWRPSLSGESVDLPGGLETVRIETVVLEEDTLEKSFVHRPRVQEHFQEEFWLLEIAVSSD